MKNSTTLRIVLIFCACLALGILVGQWTGRALGAGKEYIQPQGNSEKNGSAHLPVTGEVALEAGQPSAAEKTIKAEKLTPTKSIQSQRALSFAAPEPTSAAPAGQAARDPLPHGELKTAPNGQRNLLVLVVDDVQSRSPALKSAWLVLYLPPAPRLTLVPLYPAVFQTDEGGADLAAAFGLTPSGALAPAFLGALAEHDLWWNNFIILDHSSLALLIDLAGGMDTGAGAMSGRQALAVLKGKIGLELLKSQAGLVYHMCYSTPAAEKIRLDPETVIENLGPRIKTDLTFAELAADWQTIALTSGRQCRFPTLKFQAGAPTP